MKQKQLNKTVSDCNSCPCYRAVLNDNDDFIANDCSLGAVGFEVIKTPDGPHAHAELHVQPGFICADCPLPEAK